MRKPLVDIDRIIDTMPRWDTPFGPMPVAGAKEMRAVIQDVVTKYEAALDGARSWCKTAEENADLRKRLADLEAQLTRDYVKAVFDDEDLDMVSRRIDKLSDRVAQLERAQREGQGEL